MILSGAEIVIKMLEKEGVSYIFGYPGAANAPIYNVLTSSKINHILSRNEQGAAHMASGYARASYDVGVCMATSGPGATNLITGIATAYMDSVPIVAITGQVTREQIGKDVFQEVDITGSTAPFCKHNYLVKNTADLPRIIKEAFYIAKTGRPGPVLIDIPLDVLTEKVKFNIPKKVNILGYNPIYRADDKQIKIAVDEIIKSTKPVIIAGGGINLSNSFDKCSEFIKRTNIPVVTTLMGVGSVLSDNPLNFGMVGSHGKLLANYAINKSDLWIVMGARLADRAISNAIKRSIKIIHIDIDPAEIGKNLASEIPLIGDLNTVLDQLLSEIKGKKIDKKSFVLEIEGHKKESPYTFKDGFVNPKYAARLLSDMLNENAFVTTEVGQNQIWASNNFNIKYFGQFITSGGLGTMGYGLPAAIGAKVSDKSKNVFAFVGDGSFQMSMPELGTMCQWGIDVKIILFKNNRLGMVRELQKLKYDSNYSSVFLDGSPDFIKLVSAYGINGETISSNSSLKEAFERLIKYEGSYLLELIVDPEESTL